MLTHETCLFRWSLLLLLYDNYFVRCYIKETKLQKKNPKEETRRNTGKGTFKCLLQWNKYCILYHLNVWMRFRGEYVLRKNEKRIYRKRELVSFMLKTGEIDCVSPSCYLWKKYSPFNLNHENVWLNNSAFFVGMKFVCFSSFCFIKCYTNYNVKLSSFCFALHLHSARYNSCLNAIVCMWSSPLKASTSLDTEF